LPQPPSLADLDVLVLAGGLGTRLRPVLTDRPKVLAPVGERPFLDYLLAWLERQGSRRAVLALGHLADQVEAWLAERQPVPELEIVPVREPEPLGTGGALAFCRPQLRSDPVLVLNGDTFVEVVLDTFVAAWAESGAEAGMVAVPVADAARYGRVELSAENRVARVVEKDEAAHGAAWINGGVYLLPRALLDCLPPPPCSLERDLLERLPAGSVLAFPASGRFIDIGTPDSLAEAPGVLGDIA
jgi:mannose-1-phosphate guanylyltransferase